MHVDPATAKAFRPVDISDAHTGEGFVPRTTVLLDGVNVSAECYRAEVWNNGTGLVHILERDAGSGEFFMRDGEVASKILPGRVEIIRPS